MRVAILPALGLFLCVPGTAWARQTATTAPPRAIAAIAENDLRRDLFTLAGDAMRGREAGTLDELRASVWIGEQLARIGVKPAGDDSTFFQWWSMRRQRLSSGSIVSIGDRTFSMWSEVAATQNSIADVSGLTVWVGDGSDTTINVRGQLALGVLRPPATLGRQTSVNSPEYRYARRALQLQAQALTRRGAVGVILVADSVADVAFDGVSNITARGSYAIENPPSPGTVGPADVPAGRGAGAQPGGGRGAGRGGGRGTGTAPAPILLARASLLAEVRALAGQAGSIRLHRENFSYPSVNIVGVIPGTDPILKNEYVLYSSHQDHDGVRYQVSGDAIWNGADDNGTTSVALLAIARAFAAQPGRRSVLFVYHGAEERGLLGSRYHAANPVVPLAQIIAVLNGDMLGRNSPDSASLLGVIPPHRNSQDLVNMALQANALTAGFALDSTWDSSSHREGWYNRSDHLSYSRVNVPALFFSSTLHADYHTPHDEPQTIDYPKLTRMTRWMYMTGWIAANAANRPALDARGAGGTR
jgi:hypothetical protein